MEVSTLEDLVNHGNNDFPLIIILVQVHHLHQDHSYPTVLHRDLVTDLSTSPSHPPVTTQYKPNQ